MRSHEEIKANRHEHGQKVEAYFPLFSRVNSAGDMASSKVSNSRDSLLYQLKLAVLFVFKVSTKHFDDLHAMNVRCSNFLS